MMSFFLAAGFVACDDTFEEDYNDDVAAPQSYTEDGTYGTTFTVSESDGGVVDLRTADTNVSLFSVTAIPEYTAEEGASVAYRALLSQTDDLADAKELTLTANGTALTLPSADLDALVKDMFGKEPTGRTVYARVMAAATDVNENTLSLGSAVKTLTLTPNMRTIAASYVLNGTATGDADIAMTHSAASVYEDTSFELMFEVTGANQSFLIKAADGSQTLGAASGSETATEGTLVETGAQAITLGEPMWYKVTVDMETLAYTVEAYDMSPQLYVPGNHQGWSPATAPQMLTPSMDGVYSGYMYLDGDFKLTGQPDWGPVEYNFESVSSVSDNITQGGGTNFTIATGFYSLKYDLASNSLEATEFVWGIIGSGTVHSWDAQENMTYDATEGCWVIEDMPLTDGEIKFRGNDDWGFNFGGDLNDLKHDDPNIKVPYAGTWTIKLYFDADGTVRATMEETSGAEAPSVEIPTELYATGNNWGWGWDAPLEFTPVNGQDGVFWAIYNFAAEDQFKVNWGKDWNGNEFGSADDTVIYNNAEEVAVGGANVKVSAGQKLIVVTLSVNAAGTDLDKSIKLYEPEVFLMGSTAPDSDWSDDMPAENKFTVSDGKFVSPAIAADGNVRMYVKVDGNDWWKTEFNVFDGVITPRGNGGDQDAVSVTAGQTVELDFNAMTGEIKTPV